MRIKFLLLFLPIALAPTITQAQTPQIVAAENFYADVAQQVAGGDATVAAVMSNPDQDPHLFEASPSIARLIAEAGIVVENGADYDPWMAKLLAVEKRPDRQVIVVADLVHAKPGGNPHIWYNPATMPAYARALAGALDAIDPAHKPDTDRHLADFLASLQSLQAKVADMHRRFAGTPVTATEPVFGEMAAALGLQMRNLRFQMAVMNDTEPSAADVAAMEQDLRRHRVRVMFYNSQATDAAAKRLLRIAQQSKVPVVGVTETAPPGKHYQGWMLSQLDDLEHALSGKAP